MAATAPMAPMPPTWVYSISPTYVSQYMFRGNRRGQDSFQGAIDATNNAWDVGIWASNPIGSVFVQGQSEPEVDGYASYTYPLNSAWSVEPGISLYTFTKAPTNLGFFHATVEPNLALNYLVDGFKLQPKFYYDVTLRAPTEELNASYALPLKDLGTELDFSGSIGTYYQYNAYNHSVPKTHAWGDYWSLGVAAPYNLTKDVKLTVGWAYDAGFDAYVKQQGFARRHGPEVNGKGVFSVSLTYTW